MLGTVFWRLEVMSFFFIRLWKITQIVFLRGRNGSRAKMKQKGLGFGMRVRAHKVPSPPQPVTDPPHGEGGDHAADGEHRDGEGPVHGEDEVRGGAEILAPVSRGCQRALGATPGLRARDGAGAVLPGGVDGMSVQGGDAQHTPIVGFYHL